MTCRVTGRAACRSREAGVPVSGLLRFMAMIGDDDRPWTDRSLLRGVQYRTDANVAARQSLYSWQRPRLDLPPLVLDLAGLCGSEMAPMSAAATACT
jgi:hypothetical protein